MELDFFNLNWPVHAQNKLGQASVVIAADGNHDIIMICSRIHISNVDKNS